MIRPPNVAGAVREASIAIISGSLAGCAMWALVLPVTLVLPHRNHHPLLYCLVLPPQVAGAVREASIAIFSGGLAGCAMWALVAGAVREASIAIFSGGLAGCAMWALVLPIDVAKTRLQIAAPGDAWDVSVRRHLGMLWREGGVRALYAGLPATLVRAFPSNAAQFGAWELCMHLLMSDRDRETQALG
ncbi:hypothetical protein FOA52_007520 [Chlamydomonas sp. UWO 241]|nr:hypothetical protein FOA52_007520 [Chlamydomonas sp. UWO 241]